MQEVPNQGPEIRFPCKAAAGGGQAALERPSQWPKCAQLECKCAGREGGLTQEQVLGRTGDTSVISTKSKSENEDCIGYIQQGCA